ncbi:hypothetical protein [Thermosulfurimonas marina]|nr:hypothetical protein [Thermosulfurimonas marina]
MRDRLAGRFSYTYRTRDGKYLMASTLTLPFLRDAAADHYQSAAVLFTAPAVAIACIGHRYEVIHLPKDPSEAREALSRFASNFYQGIRYVSVPLDKAVALVQPKSKKPLIGAVVGGLALCLSLLLGGNREKTPTLPPPPPPKAQTARHTVVDPHLIAMCRSRTIILRAFREGLRAQRDLGFLGDVAFDGNGRFGLYYPLPLANTKRVNDFYVRTVIVAPTASPVCAPPELSPSDCLATLFTYHPEIEGQSATGFVLRFAGTYPIEKVAHLLAALAKCPAVVRGNVAFRDPFRRDLALHVTVLKHTPQPASSLNTASTPLASN